MNELTETIRDASHRYLPRSRPADLQALRELVLDMRWSWNHETDALWVRVDPEMWEATGNPWLILQSIMMETECSFQIALGWIRAENVFTTHTPVEAGFDRFHRELIAAYFTEYAAKLGISLEELLALGRAGAYVAEPFNMAYLAVRGCASINGVRRLHEAVSRRILQPPWSTAGASAILAQPQYEPILDLISGAEALSLEN